MNYRYRLSGIIYILFVFIHSILVTNTRIFNIIFVSLLSLAAAVAILSSYAL